VNQPLHDKLGLETNRRVKMQKKKELKLQIMMHRKKMGQNATRQNAKKKELKFKALKCKKR
jgi:hypothetical protein